MKVIISFTAGFLVPALWAICLLLVNYHLNNWSGYSPLNHIIFIPLIYLFDVVILWICFFALGRHCEKIGYVFFAGLFGGLLFALLPNQTASMISKWEVYLILFSFFGVIFFLWLATEKNGEYL